MTQHTLRDIVFDGDVFDPDNHEDQQDPEYRGLTACQAGRELQRACHRTVPDIVAVVAFLADPGQSLPPKVAGSVRRLHRYLRTEGFAL